MRAKRIPLFILNIFLITLIQAQENKTKQKDSITILEEIILNDFAITKNATGNTASAIITQEIFKNYSPVDMVSSMNQISGMYILSGALNTNRITIRGIGARTPYGTNKLRMYYNNIPVTSGTGISTIEAFDLENINAIEVIKGPKGTAYGTALGGAILLKPKEAILHTTTLSNNFTLGSYNMIKDNLSFNHNDEKLALGLQYGHFKTDGYRVNNSFERDAVLLNTSYKINPKNTISLLANYIDYTAQIPSSLNKTDFNNEPTKAAFTWNAAKGYEANKYTLLGVSYTHTFSDKLKHSTSIFYTYLDHYEPRPFNILDEFSNGYGFRSIFSGRTGKAQYTFGAELYKDEYNWSTYTNNYKDNNGAGSLQGTLLSDNKEYRRQFNAFGTLLLPITTRLTTQLGLNINKTHYDYRDLYTTGSGNKNARKGFKVIALPSLNITYNLPKEYTLYGNISRGFSNPGLEETLTPDGIINPDIEQETGVNYELGSFLPFFNRKMTLNVIVYQMNIKNLLVAQRVGEDQYIGKNAGKTIHKGLELDLDCRLDISQQLKLKPFINYTYNDHRFVDFVDESNTYSGNPLTGVPKHLLNTGVQLQHTEGFYWNTSLQHVGKMPITDANTLESDSYSVVYSRLGYKKRLTTNFTLGLDIGINNLFNTHYAQSILINASGFGGNAPRYYYPGNNRNYYGSLQLKYQL